MNHLIIAPILLPPVLAAVMIFYRDNLALHRVISVLGTAVLLAITLSLFESSTHGPEAYFLGNWPAPFGIALVLDRLAALMLLLTSVLAALVLIHVLATGWDRRGKHFHTLFLFQLMGLNGAFLTGDAFNLFVFFEVLLIASYGLMVHGGGNARLKAGMGYVAFNLLGSSLFLIALATIYAVTGTLNMADLAVKLPLLGAGETALIRLAAVLLMLVFAVKAALVPLQFWLPGTYANAPGPVAALFAVMTKVGAYALLRFGTLVFVPDLPATQGLMGEIMQPAALITMMLGAIGVLGVQDLPRRVAFTAIGSMGLLLLAISAFTPEATTAALYYLIHSTLALAMLFLLSDITPHRRDGLIAALFMAGAVATAGMPPLSGFVGKLLIMDALREQAALMWSLILIASLLTMLGLVRAGSDLFWKAETHTSSSSIAPFSPLASLLCLTALAALTIGAGPAVDWLAQTALELHNPANYIGALKLGQGG
jgi:multicomponent K+:H+ antiporter subunit D